MAEDRILPTASLADGLEEQWVAARNQPEKEWDPAAAVDFLEDYQVAFHQDAVRNQRPLPGPSPSQAEPLSASDTRLHPTFTG